MTIFALTLTGCMEDTDSGAYDRAVAALEADDYDTALAEFRTAADTDKRVTESYRGQGIVYYEKGDYETALSFFELSLSNMKYKNEEFTEDVLFYEAECLKEMGDTDKAKEIYEQLTEGSSPAQAYVLLGALCCSDGDETGAEDAFNNAISMEDAGYETYIMIYDALKDVHREADGAEYLEKALDLTPSTEEDYVLLGRICYYLEDYDKARDALSTAIDMGSIDALALQGAICLETGDIPEAKALYLDALNAGADEALCFNGLALCMAELGDFADALSYINQGLEANDSGMRRDLLFNRMVIYEKMNDYTSAKAEAEELLALYPNDEEIKNEYKFLAHA